MWGNVVQKIGQGWGLKWGLDGLRDLVICGVCRVGRWGGMSYVWGQGV